MTELLALGTALVLGFVHALEIDHMVAVTAFVSRRPAVLTALGFGVRWGIGHSLAVLAAGAVLIATGVHWSPEMSPVLEGAVGVALVGVGIWSLRATRNLHLHPPTEHGDHAHLHLHPHGPRSHRHDDHPGAADGSHQHSHDRQGITAMGLLHGLAGTSTVVALVPVTLFDRAWLGVAYLAAFGVGVTAGMGLFAVVVSLALRQAAERSLRWGRRVARLAGVASVLVGCWWLGRVLFAG